MDAFREGEKINCGMKQYYGTEDSPKKENGGANILSVNPNVVLVRHELKRLRKKLQKMGVKCLCVDFDETLKTGTGGPRCAILPLVRG